MVPRPAAMSPLRAAPDAIEFVMVSAIAMAASADGAPTTSENVAPNVGTFGTERAAPNAPIPSSAARIPSGNAEIFLRLPVEFPSAEIAAATDEARCESAPKPLRVTLNAHPIASEQSQLPAVAERTVDPPPATSSVPRATADASASVSTGGYGSQSASAMTTVAATVVSTR
jgi:hypothetical protein